MGGDDYFNKLQKNFPRLRVVRTFPKVGEIFMKSMPPEQSAIERTVFVTFCQFLQHYMSNQFLVKLIGRIGHIGAVSVNDSDRLFTL